MVHGRRDRRPAVAAERLERRWLLAAQMVGVPAHQGLTGTPAFAAGSNGPFGFSTADVRAAYGLNAVSFDGVDRRRVGPDDRPHRRLRRPGRRRHRQLFLHRQRPLRVRPGHGPARPAVTGEGRPDRQRHGPARPGRRRRVGRGDGPGRRVGPRRRPGRQPAAGRVQLRRPRRPDHRRRRLRPPAGRRVGRVHELRRPRGRHRDRVRRDLHHARRPHGHRVRRRRRRRRGDGPVPGRLAERDRRRRHHRHPRRRHLLQRDGPDQRRRAARASTRPGPPTRPA